MSMTSYCIGWLYRYMGIWSLRHFTIDGRITLCGLTIPGGATTSAGTLLPCLLCERTAGAAAQRAAASGESTCAK